MALVIYDGKGKLFYYTHCIRSMGGVEQNIVITYPNSDIVFGWLGDPNISIIINKFIKKLITKPDFQDKEFPILKLQSYIKKKLDKIITKPENKVYKALIYCGNYNGAVYVLDESGLEVYNLSDCVIIGNRGEFAQGAMKHIDDGNVVMQEFAKRFPICNSPYKTIVLWS